MLADRNPLPDAITGDLRRQLEFILEVDQLKAVLRESSIAAEPRPENDAEHTWHLTLMALVLQGYADEPVDIGRVLELLIVHDLVEVYAGDTPLRLKDDQQEVREREAADRLFPLLPGDQGDRLRAAWEEFEAHETPEARFARSMDRLQPLLLEWLNAGTRWQENDTHGRDSRGRLGIIADGSTTLWDAAESIIGAAQDRGYLRSD